MQHDTRAPGGSTRDLRGRRIAGHDDGGRHTPKLRMPRYGLGVIAGRHCDDTAALFLGRQEGEAVGGTTLLEGTGRLEVFQLERDLGPGCTRDFSGAQDGRSCDRAGDAGGRCLHIG